MSEPVEDDPRRWLTLTILLASLLIIVLDNTVLTVAIPTIVRELDTDLDTVKWVLTGYSLTFASLLIIGGRLGDFYGGRQTFIVGAALFGTGSLLASLSQSVGHLLIGEALIEGVGAALMMPATLAIMSTTFRGRERATAFAAWGAVAGGAVAFGPLVGGYLTTYHSWRWAFGINVIVTPLAIAAAVLLIPRQPPVQNRPRLDIPGAVLAAAGTFLLVLGISEADIRVPLFAAAVVVLGSFVAVERWMERNDRAPLFELSQLRLPCFRYGLMTSLVLAMGQLGMLFVLPVFLQDGKHVTAMENGLWFVPMGIAILAAAQLSGRLTRVMGTTTLVRIGLVLDAAGLLLMAALVSPSITFLGMLPALVLFGLGVGCSSAQLTNVVLYEIPPGKAGVASGANSTVRQVGTALGVTLIGSVLATQTAHELRQGATRVAAVAAASRPSLLVAAGIVTVGMLLSFLIPHVDQREPSADVYDVAEPIDTGMARR